MQVKTCVSSSEKYVCTTGIKSFYRQEHVFPLLRIMLALLGKTIGQSKLFVSLMRITIFTDKNMYFHYRESSFYMQKVICFHFLLLDNQPLNYVSVIGNTTVFPTESINGSTNGKNFSPVEKLLLKK